MKFDRACMSYKTAIELRKYRESFDPSSLMSLYSNTARAYSYCHNFKDAIDLIDKAYLFRKDNYNIDPNKNRGMYILTTKYYGEILLHMGIYAKKRNEKLNYWNQSREKLAEIYEIVKNYKNMYSTSEYWEIYGQLCYYLREWPKSESYFKTAISQLEPLVASEHRCITANIYLGKIYYSMDNPKVAYDYFSKAFKMSEELLNPYSYCYTRMVAAFNLGGFLYLTAGVVDLPSSEETDLLMLAKELILRSHEDIKALMEPSENIPEEYKYINNIAFKTEEQCIKEFVDNIEKNDNDIETETRKNLKKEFLDFYVSHQ